MIRVYKWEVLKLLAQKRTYLGLGAAMLVPLIFVTVLILKTGGPNDIPLGRYIRQTGLATPFVVLFFMSIWAFPLITALVAGDIVASESHNGTLKTILTRSRNRGEIFAAKILATFTYTAVVVFAMGAVAFVAASIEWGFNDLTSLSGTTVSAWHGLGLLAASLAIYAWPMAGDRGVRALPLDGHAQQRRRGRRHADVGAADAAARRAAGHGVDPPVPARRAVPGVARLPAHAGRLDADRARALGLRALRRDPARRSATSSSCAATSPASSSPPRRARRARARVRGCTGRSASRRPARLVVVEVAQRARVRPCRRARSQRPSARRPAAVSSVRITRPCPGSARRRTYPSSTSSASTSLIDCGVTSDRRASCAFDSPSCARSTDSAV